MWSDLERFIQDDLVLADEDEEGLIGEENTVFIVAGVVYGPGPVEKVGPDEDIHVPPMFWKVVIIETDEDPFVLAFLFPHHRVKRGEIQHYLTSVNVIEQLTGLNFFRNLPESDQQEIEDLDTWETWVATFGE